MWQYIFIWSQRRIFSLIRRLRMEMYQQMLNKCHLCERAHQSLLVLYHTHQQYKPCPPAVHLLSTCSYRYFRAHTPLATHSFFHIRCWLLKTRNQCVSLWSLYLGTNNRWRCVSHDVFSHRYSQWQWQRSGGSTFTFGITFMSPVRDWDM
jgi:hypothetical protein